jgi:hypothetical protein
MNRQESLAQPQPEADLSGQVAAVLRQSATATSQALQSVTGKSQASISLALGQLGSQVCKLGAARSTRYALTRPILGLPASNPLLFTHPHGPIEEFGRLTQLHDGQIHVRSNAGQEWLSQAGQLPWFLQTLRPEGFLGRRYTRLRPDFPADPDTWTAEQVLYLAVNHINEPPGAFQVGEVMGRIVREAPFDLKARVQHYESLVQNLQTALPAGSSAGGEQPKFVVETGDLANGGSARYQHLIVKYAPPRGTLFGERWHDLLRLEHLALQVLDSHGLAVAESHIVQTATRTYLESSRFDRLGAEGKRHVVSAGTAHGEFVKTPQLNWANTCEALVAQKRLSQADLARVVTLVQFGRLIGNTDMHFGNLSFFVDDVAKPYFQLAPVYDMLPMKWRPSIHDGALSAEPVQAQPSLLGFANEQAAARQMAVAFWEQAAAMSTLHADLREGARRSAIRVKSHFKQDA